MKKQRGNGIIIDELCWMEIMSMSAKYVMTV